MLATLPSFTLTSSDGQVRRDTDLKGKVWVADFIFTQCPGVCPLLTAHMARVQAALAHEGLQDVRLVSFSVDPTHDTPAALQEYAKRHRADTQSWWFLTGDRDSLYTLIGKGFLLAVAERRPDPQAETQELITHSDRFVLVDRDLQIRGYYRPLEEDGLQNLLADLRHLHAS